MMASCVDLSKLSSPMDSRSITKATPITLAASKKFVEPFYRLRNRANLFRRKHYSSQLDISSHCSPLSGDHSNPSDGLIKKHTNIHIAGCNNNIILKRSNSMTCPQQRLQTILNAKDIKNNTRNSICVELSGCPTDESSTDDFRVIQSPANNYWNKKLHSTMSHITEQDAYQSEESLEQNKIETVPSLSNNKNESIKQISTEISRNEQKQSINSPITPLTSAFISRNNQSCIDKRQSTCSSYDEAFFDCKQDVIPMKSTQNFDMSSLKMSICTMTGKSLDNLDECLSSEDKGVQTTLNDSLTKNLHAVRNNSSTSLSSSTASMQTDSLENKPKVSKLNETSKNSNNQRLIESYHKSPQIYERLVNEQNCIYWVNYLGSTSIKISNDDTPTMPAHAINRLKESTQYARVLPIIGLSISPRGVEFLKHTKDRVAICFHDIKSIYCACQDKDLRYFAYVTREKRTNNSIPYGTNTLPSKKQLTSNHADYHNYCHVFVVKNESMSTEILLTFGQAFDIAYQDHRRSNSKAKYSEKTHRNVDAGRFTVQSNKIISSSTHSPGTSSSSSSSIDERKIFI